MGTKPLKGRATDRETVLAAFDQHQTWWESVLDRASLKDEAAPGVAGEWSFKDVVAHLNGWQARTIRKLGGVADRPFPADLTDDEDSDEGVETINQWLHDANE